MPFDLLIKNGTVVDGTGQPGFRADVAVQDGVIAAVGAINDSAARVIDASGRVVCPGFIDLHTHYDAQICWDPVLSPSSWHGITTMVIGNCGVGLAPCPPALREMSLWDLTNVESIPMDVLRAGVQWEWESFPEYLDAAEHRAMGVNVASIAPLTPFRHAVMGEESLERAANSAEAQAIAALLRDAVAAGAFGFSASKVPSHVGYKGKQLASYNTSDEEFRAYAHALRDAGKGVIAIAVAKVPGRLSDDEYRLIDLLLTESGRPLTFMSVFARDDDPHAHMETLRKIEPLVARGALPQTTPKPLVSLLDMTNPFLFSHFQSARGLFNAGREEQKRIYADPAFRAAFRADAAKVTVAHTHWEYYEVQEVANPELKRFEGRTVADIAREQNKDPFDVFFDLTLADELRIRFQIVLLNGNDDGVAELVGDPRVILGLSDGGAHIDQLCDAGYPTFLLQKWVREKHVLTLERAIQRMTSEPADFMGMRSRGRLQAGKAADIVVFDPDTVGSGRPQPRFDVPGGARRLVVEPVGIDYTIVNGSVLFDHGRETQARSGRLLRSGAA